MASTGKSTTPGADLLLAPIRVASLLTGTIPDFDLYLPAGPDQAPVLYRESNLPVTEDVLRRLEANRVDTLYVDFRQRAAYRRYLEGNIRTILADEALPVEEKSEILYTSLQGMVADVMEDPASKGSVRRTREIVVSSLHFLRGERRAFASLVRTAALDYTIYTHSVNVMVYSLALATRVRLGDHALIQQFGIGALLHDIGLSQLDPAVVQARDRLTPDQRELYTLHPLLGWRLLQDQGGVGQVGLEAVRNHHERLDGTGYPDAKRGSQVSEPARIAAIADTFDQLTTYSADRDALNSFAALKAMDTEIAAGLDREMLHAFIELMGRPEA